MSNLIHQLSLKWPEQPLEWFAKLAHLPWAMLLDSSNAKHMDARYDIIVADPLATLVSKDGESRITQDSSRQVSNDDPFELLQGLLNDYFPTPISSALPFSGGSLGYFSYDLGRYCEQMPNTAARDIDTYDMAVGLYDWALIADHQLQTLTLVHCGCEQGLQSRARWLEQQVAPKLSPFCANGAWQLQQTQSQYNQSFEKIQQHLLSGDCYQINLTQRFELAYQGDEFEVYLRLREHNQAPFGGFIRLEDHAILSLSPERFIQAKGGWIETKPIKGTRPRFDEPDADQASASELANADKDRAENLMIVDLLRNDFGRVAGPGSVEVTKLFAIESFPAVHHLVSTIQAQLAPGLKPLDALRAAFPGGSITGAPKIRAMQIIEALEPSRRSVYCGSLGYVSQDGQMDTSICIRTLVAQQQTLYCWAGGGIVADSQMNAEYQETFDKVSKILPILAPVEGRD
ncbi:aminodeoxychorismate synthase component I [Paraferrimonas sedimenticola]|uniref:aminodeoxychorismate synthase n=1 Tax=Paraferrimonas sedimenticola TaxID=375674 RepID=A0AA37RWA5_9GAMM|nr:aminodeoxychorismate synthase component I [Paraferrimonas sedimenticola]GLP96426.1 aminodeoxychorismate synthase, component I [Paraferrimonas sedimenticola]